MKIMLITQGDVFYLPKIIDLLTKRLSQNYTVISIVKLDPSPSGKKKSLLKQSVDTLKIFGIRFFTFYTFLYIYNKLIKQNTIDSIAEANGVEVIKLIGSINEQKNINRLKSYNADLLISVAANEIFKRPVLDIFPKGCLNLHTSLLPKYRGLMPTFWVLRNNERYTGVTVFIVDEGIDSGPIVEQQKVEIGKKTQRELIIATKLIGVQLIEMAVNKILNNELNLQDNNADAATYFQYPTRKDVKIFYKNGKKFF